SHRPRELIFAGILVAVGAMAPLVPWTMRNLHTLHRFQPLAPRYANDSDEFVMAGFNRWVKTWIADYVSVQEIYWPVPGSDMDFSRLPNRAFDSPEQRKETSKLFSEYNESRDITPELDAGFAALAAQRVRSAPMRYYVWLPALRIADMWLRPRTELFPSDPRWWEFNDDHRWLAVSLAFGAINLFYVVMSVLGLVRSRAIFGIGLFVFFLLLRSAFLGSLENPEPRYPLECYPAVLFGATVTLANASTGFSRTVKSGNDGVYQFLEVPPATYVLTVTVAGFATIKQDNVTLQVSQPATLDVTLQVAGATEVVEVSG